MRDDGLKGCPKRRFRRSSNATPEHPIAKNLLKQDFRADERNRRWASDITQLWTKQGWLYLAVVMDLYSRRIIGWSMSGHIDHWAKNRPLCSQRKRPDMLNLPHHDMLECRGTVKLQY
jgi:transposase InsO family protein